MKIIYHDPLRHIRYKYTGIKYVKKLTHQTLRLDIYDAIDRTIISLREKTYNQ